MITKTPVIANPEMRIDFLFPNLSLVLSEIAPQTTKKIAPNNPDSAIIEETAKLLFPSMFDTQEFVH